MDDAELRVALLCDDDFSGYQTAIRDHIESFAAHSRHRVVPINPRGLRHGFGLSLDGFDALIIHFSLWIVWPDYLPDWMRRHIRRFTGPKLLFIQDEYRMVDRAAAAITDLGIHVLYSAAEPEVWSRLYHHAGLRNVRIRPTLTGYVPRHLESLQSPGMNERKIHIGYRAREQMAWLGALAQEKRAIAEGVENRMSEAGLCADISTRTEDTIFGPAWFPFLMGCKATLGTESGASVVDFGGTLPDRVADYRAHHPGAGYGEIARDLLASLEGVVTIRAISPRVFEAAATRTALVMFPGHYNGLVQPWEHYLPLAKDFSNFSEIAAHLRDDAFLTALTERTHAALVRSNRFSYRNFVAGVDDDLAADVARLGLRRRRVRWASGMWQETWRQRSKLARRLDLRLRHGEDQAGRLLRLIRLAAVFLTSPSAWAAFSRLRRNATPLRLMADLARFVILAHGRVGEVIVDAERHGCVLVLRGRVAPSTAQGWEEAVAALARGDITELRWCTDLAPGNRPALMDDGAYHFETLTAGLADGTLCELLRPLRGLWPRLTAK